MEEESTSSIAHLYMQMFLFPSSDSSLQLLSLYTLSPGSQGHTWRPLPWALPPHLYFHPKLSTAPSPPECPTRTSQSAKHILHYPLPLQRDSPFSYLFSLGDTTISPVTQTRLFSLPSHLKFSSIHSTSIYC